MTSPVNGIVKSLAQVDDPVFSTNTMGEGIAIIPESDFVVSPVSGVITCLFKTKHAIEITTDLGVEILIHIGIDTVRLDGNHFECYVKQGEEVTQGEPLIRFHQKEIREEGYQCDIMMIITNTEQYQSIDVIAADRIKQGAPLLKIK